MNPPRSVFVDAPLGHTAGPPGDAAMQRFIVSRALELGTAMTAPGTITDLDVRWHHDDWKRDPLGWSRRREDAGARAAPAATGDTRTERSIEPRYQSPADRTAAEAVDRAEQCRTCLGLPDA